MRHSLRSPPVFAPLPCYTAGVLQLETARDSQRPGPESCGAALEGPGMRRLGGHRASGLSSRHVGDALRYVLWNVITLFDVVGPILEPEGLRKGIFVCCRKEGQGNFYRRVGTTGPHHASHVREAEIRSPATCVILPHLGTQGAVVRSDDLPFLYCWR